MWAFLLILALVPIIFFWSDAVEGLFPQLKGYFFDKDKPVATARATPDAEVLPLAQAGGAPGAWYSIQTEQGYAAWLISDDGAWRLAVGCRTGMPAALQVTHLTLATPADELTLNYRQGTLPLAGGVFAGPSLLGAVAQFQDVYLQQPSGEVQAVFQANGSESGVVAHEINLQCPEVWQEPAPEQQEQAQEGGNV